MHRSGTSAFTGALEGIGVKLGGTLAEGHTKINEKGYKEDIALIDLHENLLWSLPSSWDDIFPLNLAQIDQQVLCDSKLKIRKILLNYFKRHNCCGLKDPRVCLFLPLWLEVCAQEEIEVCFVVPFRNPCSVAKSLHARNGFLSDRSSVLWAKYLIAAEHYSRGYPRVMISYESLIIDPKKALKVIMQNLELPIKGNLEDQIVKGSKFVTTRLNHSDSIVPIDNFSPSFVVDLYKILLELDGEGPSSDFNYKFDEVSNSYFQYFEKLDPVFLDQLNTFKGHAKTFRSYWRNAMNSKAIKISQTIKKFPQIFIKLLNGNKH